MGAPARQPDCAEAYCNRGRVSQAKGDLRAALADYNRAVELRPGLAEAYWNRATLKQAKSDMRGALADYKKAIQLKSELTKSPDYGQYKSAQAQVRKGFSTLAVLLSCSGAVLIIALLARKTTRHKRVS